MSKIKTTERLKKRQSKYSEALIFEARYLYLKKFTPQEIAKELGLNSPRPVYYWAEKYQWRNLIGESGIEELVALRIATLIEREHKTAEELKELDQLIERDIQYKAQRAKRQTKNSESGGNDVGQSENSDKKTKKTQRSAVKNDVSAITEEMFEPFLNSLFDYQHTARNAMGYKVRIILKSRQIGATYYFAFEALENAIKTGDNQIFLSASKKQSEIFKTYIVKMAREFFGVELKGSPIILSNGAELHFLSTNKSTAQGYHGHIYGDEFAWVRDFEQFYTVASAMATHKKWRETYFSTPSSKFHSSYAFWSGELWKGADKKRQSILFPAAESLHGTGQICPDGAWRFIVDIEDAVRGGADSLFDIEQLKTKYSKVAFEQLFMCRWIDDTYSIFNVQKLLKCAVDSTKWQDFNPKAARPFGSREVWCGYDPAHSFDGASFVVVAPPILSGEKYRILERHQWHGQSYRYQAARIKEIWARYNVGYIGIDTNGVGHGVYEMVHDFAKSKVKPILYTPESKAGLVLKVHDLIEHNLLEWDENEKDIPASFLLIKQAATQSGNKITYIADRTAQNQHADVFWAITHAINKRELNDKPKRRKSWNFN